MWCLNCSNHTPGSAICSRPQLNCLQSGIQDQDQNAMKFPFVSCFGCKEGQGCWCLCVYPFLLPYLLICSSAQVICLQSRIQDQYQKFRICETPWPKFLQVYYSRMWVIQMMWSLKCSNHRPGLMSTRHETASTGKIAKHCAVPASIATMVQVSSLLFELFFFVSNSIRIFEIPRPNFGFWHRLTAIS